MPASPEENRSFPLGFRAKDLWGMPLRTKERKGTSRRGPGQPPLDRASSARPAHRTTARRARSQDVQEDPELLRAGSGPALGSIEEFLNDGKQDKGNHSFHYIHYVSLYYVVGFLSVSASGESSHNGLSEGLRRSLNQPTGTSGGKQNKTKPAVSCGQKLPVILLKREGGGKNRPGDTVEQHCHLQATETKTPQARKKIHRFCWVFPQRTGQRGRES
ncbi:uncharacterized protein [Bos taurus]|uniref:uncharacterized protein n=1 Tax=Bos taurus TaxID=9913 RepID=UPI000383CF82|nr:uncharacterized protein LOC112445040 [Bos taurus]